MLALFALAMPRQAVLAALDDMEHELALIGYERMMKTAKAATTGGDGTPVFDTDEAAAEHFAATEPSRLTNVQVLFSFGTRDDGSKAEDAARSGWPCESWMSGDVGGHKGLDKVSRTGELKRLFDQLDGQVVPLRAIASHTRGAKLSGTELADIVKGHLPKL